MVGMEMGFHELCLVQKSKAKVMGLIPKQKTHC